MKHHLLVTMTCAAMYAVALPASADKQWIDITDQYVSCMPAATNRNS